MIILLFTILTDNSKLNIIAEKWYKITIYKNSQNIFGDKYDLANVFK